MAQKVKIILIDDIDGSDATETINFSLENVNYEIDLNDEHAAELRESFNKWITHGRRVAARRGRRGAARPAGSSDAAKIRQWARENGYEVSERGRVSAEIREAYEQRAK